MNNAGRLADIGAEIDALPRAVKPARRIRRLPDGELESKPGSETQGPHEIAKAAGGLIGEALTLGAFSREGYSILRNWIRQPEAWQPGDLASDSVAVKYMADENVRRWDATVWCLVPGLRGRDNDLGRMQAWIDGCAPIARILRAAVKDAATSEAGQKPKRRKRPPVEAKPLTEKQVEAVQIVGECKGSVAEAAKRLGKDRATVRQHYQAAQRKMGKAAVKHATKGIPTDRRGQANLSEDDDRRR